MRLGTHRREWFSLSRVFVSDRVPLRHEGITAPFLGDYFKVRHMTEETEKLKCTEVNGICFE